MARPQRRLLWIKGNPGKGMTMLVGDVIEELKDSAIDFLSYISSKYRLTY
jgi:hypothetical protein